MNNNARSNQRFTIAHVTHEAVEQIGGIGTVLEGMMISPVYQQRVRRSILIGPLFGHLAAEPTKCLGHDGTVLYSSIDGIDEAGLAAKFRPIEWAFNIRIVYGVRRYNNPGEGRRGEAEVLLVDIFNTNKDRLNLFKSSLHTHFGIDSARYESEWGFEEYCRLAEPAYYALNALLDDEDLPCVLISHEYMGMCTALQAKMEGGDAFRTVFHGHECATARSVTEEIDGHDIAFYNAMRQASGRNLFIDDVFGSQDHNMRHALISRAHCLDGVIAVGEETANELHFLSPEMSLADVDVVYNGLPVMPVDLKSKLASRVKLDDWAEKIIGWRPNYLMTHVTRPVVSKGIWRDLKVASQLDEPLGREGKRALVVILACGASPRSERDVRHMAEAYGWPANHREGYPDLVGPEVDIWRDMAGFNFGHKNVQAILVNQFGWSRSRLGPAACEDMDIADLRRAADVEFGQSIYEPFGISQLEPLGSGAICVVTGVCGCCGFVEDTVRRLGEPIDAFPNILIPDYTHLPEPWSLDRLIAMTREQRDRIEAHVAAQVSRDLFKRLPRSDADRARLIQLGQKLATNMGWDDVLEHGFFPLLERL
ncbi:MAG: glycosyltransferase [Phycisphaerales bacterium]|nr:glycosyltransferase [Phycisphaerales bacterium]